MYVLVEFASDGQPTFRDLAGSELELARWRPVAEPGSSGALWHTWQSPRSALFLHGRLSTNWPGRTIGRLHSSPEQQYVKPRNHQQRDDRRADDAADEHHGE